jgi:cold shock protein
VIDETRYTGVVKFYGDKGAWGFITPNDGSKEMFVHVTAVGAAGLRGLESGQAVEYSVELDERRKRPCAVNLRLI